MPYIHYYHSPIGALKITAEEAYITGLSLEPEDEVQETPITPMLQEACKQLEEYFSGTRTNFELPIKYVSGTPFQHSVWNALRNIPYGETRSYEDVAVAIGNPKAVRAIGQANNKNPILLLVPCHRVINKNGSIGGFGCGVEVKKQLLQLEAILSAGVPVEQSKADRVEKLKEEKIHWEKL